MVLKPRKNIQVFDSCNFFAHHFLSFIKNNFLFTKLKPPGHIHYLQSLVNKRIIRIFISAWPKKEAVPKVPCLLLRLPRDHIKI